MEARASKEELGGGLLGIIRWVSTKTLPTHSTLHLQVFTPDRTEELRITVRNVHKKRQSHCIFIHSLNENVNM